MFRGYLNCMDASQDPEIRMATTLDEGQRDAARISAELVSPGGGTDPFAAAVRTTRMPMVVTDPRSFLPMRPSAV